MPFTLPLIGHLSHAWFHLIKLGWLHRENGLEKPATQILFWEPLLTLIRCQDNWRESQITSFYLNGIFCSSFSLISFKFGFLCLVFCTLMWRTVWFPHSPTRGVLSHHLPSFASWFWGPLSHPWAQEVIKQDANPSLSEQGHWPSLPHIWWWVLSARQMSKIQFPKHNHFGSAANFSLSATHWPSEKEGWSSQ